MKYASEDLMHEHEAIVFSLTVLEKIALLLKRNEKVDFEDLKNMIFFLKTFADKCHHGKEEGFYFPALEQAGIPNKNGPIGQMLLEHAQGRVLISQMNDAVEAKVFKAKTFADAAMGYVTLLRQHIVKENNILFPLGDKMLPPTIEARLIKQFDDYEEEVMGKGTHEKLHEMLDHFEEKYIKLI